MNRRSYGAAALIAALSVPGLIERGVAQPPKDHAEALALIARIDGKVTFAADGKAVVGIDV